MIRRKTVLVLGAGASVPLGFPSAVWLVNEVAKIDGWHPRALSRLHTALHHMCGESRSNDEIRMFARLIRGSVPASVDLFLELPENEQWRSLGRLAMARVLRRFEDSESVLQASFYEWGRRPDRAVNEPPVSAVPAPFYRHLWWYLQAPSTEFGQNQLFIINFNYDRSLKHFLWTAASDLWQLPPERTRAVLRSGVQIVHVHGSLGLHPGFDGDSEQSVPFNADRSDDPEDYLALVRAAKTIKIVANDSKQDEEYEQAKAWLRQSELICFLGFSFGEANANRLQLHQLVTTVRHQQILPCAFGIGQFRRTKIAQMLGLPYTVARERLMDGKLDALSYLQENVHFE